MNTSVKRLKHPFYLKRLYVHWRLRILRHEFTGKLAHHQHTSYPILGILVLCAGIALTYASSVVFADTQTISHSLTVSAFVAGDVPSQAATIDSPVNGQSFTNTPITVTGKCPLSTYLQLFRNNYPSGTVYCQTDGTYSVQTDLFDQTNTLVIRDYNLADQPGPDSNSVNVVYIPPGGTPAIASSSDTSNTTGEDGIAPTQPLVLRNNFRFRGYDIGDSASWDVAIFGGTAPYSVTVDWGDNHTAQYVSKTADTLTLTHSYKSPGPLNGSYAILVHITDAIGTHSALQIMALINGVVQATTGTTSDGSAATSSGTGTPVDTVLTMFGTDTAHFFGLSWSLYIALCPIIMAFWLGERRELRLIKRNYRVSKKA